MMSWWEYILGVFAEIVMFHKRNVATVILVALATLLGYWLRGK